MLAGGLATIAFFSGGCSRAYENPFRDAQRNETIQVGRGDTYWEYATRLQGKNSKLREWDKRDLCFELRKYNEGKELQEGDTAVLPYYP